MLGWISIAIFSVAIIWMSFVLMCKLRHRFDDFYGEYGCYLWTIVTIQALSLIVLFTSQALLNSSKVVYQYFFFEISNLNYHICWIIFNIVAVIVPIITQLSCLIFGWIRYRRGENKPKLR